MPSPFPNLPPFQRGTLDLQRHSSRVLRDNPWKDPSERDLWVYLPPGYASAKEALPAVFFLPGFAGTGEKFFGRGLHDPSLPSTLDHLIAQGCPPFLGVFSDCMTRLGGSQYVDSPALGAYASYLIEEIRPFVEGRYRCSGAWGAVGHSSGGFGALHLAMNFPGALQAIACHAGDMGFDLCYLGDLPKAVAGIQAAGGLQRFLQTFWDEPDPSPAAFSALNVLAMACAYDPKPGGGSFPANLPFDPESGAIDFAAFQRWSAYDPLVQVEDPASAAALRDLRLLCLDAGNKDEYGLHLGARRLVKRLTALGIGHSYEEFPGGHRNLTRRYALSVPKVVGALT